MYFPESRISYSKLFLFLLANKQTLLSRLLKLQQISKKISFFICCFQLLVQRDLAKKILPVFYKPRSSVIAKKFRPMPQYVLCSSSGEEESGEVAPRIQGTKRSIDLDYIFSKSLYHKSIFVGRNHKLSSLGISFSEKKLEYVKNRLKKKAPFSFVMAFISSLDEPVQKLAFHKDAVCKKSNFVLEGGSGYIGKIERVPHCKTFKDLYSEVFALVAENNEIEKKLSIDTEKTFKRTILIQDAVLNNLSELRVPFTVADSRTTTKILFHNYIPQEISLGKATGLYGECCIGQAALSKEIRLFSCKDTALIVFSTSVFIQDDKEYRVYKNVDRPKNCNALVEEEGIRIVKGYEEGLSYELDTINGLCLSDGEYFLYKHKIYKLDSEQVEDHNSIDYNSMFTN